MESIEIVMQHSEQTLQQLARMQYNLFHPFTRYFWYLVSGLSVAAGLGLIGDFPQLVRYLLLAFGPIAFMNIGATASVKADKTMQAIQRQGGKFPRTVMVFRSKEVFVRETTGNHGAQTLDYSRFIRLSEDKDYLYLFINREAAYMVPVEQLSNPDKFKRLVESKTGQAFTAPASLLTFNLHSLLRSFSRRKRSRKK